MRARWGVLGLLIVALGAGCGGGKTLTKEQYVSQLNAMCNDFSAREKKIGEPHTLQDLAERGPQILDAFDKAIGDKVGKLKAPDEIAGDAKRLAEIADQQHKTLGELVAAANGGDLSNMRELSARNVALNKEAESIARKIGARGCT